MMLADRLRAALAEGHHDEAVLLVGDDRGIGLDDATPATPAAVLVPITDRPEPGVLLTVRNATMRRHAGQVAFPGGKIDPGDDGPIAAAVREAEEEIGLSRELIEIVGEVDCYRTITGYHITPVIGVIPPDLALVPHDLEVATVFEVPLAFLLDPANHVEQVTDWKGRQHHFHEMIWEGHRIWGATAAMIVNIARRLAGRL